MMETKVLSSEQEIVEAQKLAYEVLVKELEWSLRSDNPSGLYVKDIPEGKILCDDYDTVATWLGVFEQNTLVGCLRICRRLKGKFELERYHPLLNFIQEDELAWEATRLAVRKQFRMSTAVLRLYKISLEILLSNNGGYLFATAPWPNPGKMHVNKFGMTRHEIPFRYHSEDPQEVYLYYINGYDRLQVIEKVCKFETFLERESRKQKL